MTLTENTLLTGALGGTYTVGKYLAEGGQGSVHFVRDKKGHSFVVKWYFEEQATDAQRTSIQKLVNDGPPKGKFHDRFIWPLDLVTMGGSPLFGYVMPLIDSQFCDLIDVVTGKVTEPTLSTMCKITAGAAASYKMLHASGQCYRDISHGNLMFDRASGDVRICDNDNVGPDGNTTAQVRGTWEYMAPEVATRAADPSTRTDLHSLAVLLFKLWMWHHPLHGLQEGRIRSLDDAAFLMLYGKSPIFIFDPKDRTNAAASDDPDYKSVNKRWNLCSPEMQDLFKQAFTDGLRDPARRVTEGQWQLAAHVAFDNFFSCSHCKAENAMAFGSSSGQCWNCKQPLPALPWLRLKTPSGVQRALLKPGFTLKPRHLSGDVMAEGEVIGKLTQHPNDPSVWGLRNQGRTPWKATFADGTSTEVLADRSVPLNDRTEIAFHPSDNNGPSGTILAGR